MPDPVDSFILTLACPDRPGIVHAVTGVLAGHRANITEAQQFNDPGTGLFFMRVLIDGHQTVVFR